MTIQIGQNANGQCRSSHTCGVRIGTKGSAASCLIRRRSRCRRTGTGLGILRHSRAVAGGHKEAPGNRPETSRSCDVLVVCIHRWLAIRQDELYMYACIARSTIIYAQRYNYLGEGTPILAALSIRPHPMSHPSLPILYYGPLLAPTSPSSFCFFASAASTP